MKTILSLFDHSGQWSKPYRDAGYSVDQIDLKLGTDVLDTLAIARSGKAPPIHGILMAPPCTDFSGSGAQYWPAKDGDGRTAASLKLIDAGLELVRLLSPTWWCMENPAGRLNTLRPSLALHGPHYFDPCDFAGYLFSAASLDSLRMLQARQIVADGGKLSREHVQAVIDSNAYTKRTGLWGSFTWPKENRIDPVRCSSQGSWTQLLGGKSERTKELRSITPAGFALAFFQTNP